MANEAARERWYFGVFCLRCATFIPVRPDESGGRAGAKLAASGTIIATCVACGTRGRYATNRVEQRRAEPRAPLSGDAGT